MWCARERERGEAELHRCASCLLLFCSSTPATSGRGRLAGCYYSRAQQRTPREPGHEPAVLRGLSGVGLSVWSGLGLHVLPSASREVSQRLPNSGSLDGLRFDLAFSPLLPSQWRLGE